MVRVVVRSLAVLTLLFFFTGCRNYVAYVYTGLDPTSLPPSKTEPIFFVIPDNPSIRERKLAVLLKDELIRNGFNIVSDFGESKWTLTFALDRNTYTVGSTSYDSPSLLGNKAITTYNKQTDIIIFMYLFKSEDFNKQKPVVLWEGSIATKDLIFTKLPNSTIKNLLDRFGQNFETFSRLNKDYQRDINVQKTAK